MIGLKVKGTVLGDKFWTRDIHRLLQAKENIFVITSFREIMESDAMWQFIEQVSGFNIEVTYPYHIILQGLSLRINYISEMRHLGKNKRSIANSKQTENK